MRITRRAGAQYPCVTVTVSQPLEEPRPGPPSEAPVQAATNGALARPGRSGSQQRSWSSRAVGQHEARAPDDDHRDLPRRSLRDELTIRRAQVRVVPGRRAGM